MLPTRDSLQGEGHTDLKLRGWKRYFMEMKMTRKVGVAISISEKTDFKTKAHKDKGYYKITNRINTRKGYYSC